MSSSDGPVLEALAGFRVLDLSSGIAGSYCTKLLHDAGADVVKLEPPGGDPLRTWTASRHAATLPGVLFRFLHAGKRVTTASNRAATLQLAGSADLIVESGELTDDDIETVLRANPHLVVVSITPFGRSGPWRDRPATEFTLQALCGSTAFRGTPDREPLAAGGRLGEWITGVYAAVAALACARAARLGASGEHVDVSMLECMTVAMTPLNAVHASMGGPVNRPPRSVELPSIEPTADGFVGLCTITAQQFEDFCVMIERPELFEEFASALVRQKRAAEFLPAVHAWTTQRTTDEIVELASLFRIPVTRLGEPRTITELDHFVERGVFVTHPDGFVLPRPPYRIGEMRWRGPERIVSVAGNESIGWEPRMPSAAMPPRADGRPLTGIRVLDLTAFWSGPSATQMLAGLGAEVVKVESIQRPDGMRFTTIRPATTDQWWEWSPLFQALNVDKRGVTLDLGAAEGREVLLRLAEQADALVENFSPRVLDTFGITWEQLHERNPRLEFVRMPAFGLDGPWRERTGFAQTMEQVSGMAWLTGFADRPPIVPRGPCDPLAGMHAAFALLVALAERDRSGEGRLLEATMVEGALNAAAELVLEWTAYGEVLMRAGNRSAVGAPTGLYACAGEEEWLALCVRDDGDWQALRAALGDPEWMHDAALDEASGRFKQHDMIDAGINAWACRRSVDDAVDELLAVGVPAAAVTIGADVLKHEVHHARGFVETIDHPVVGRFQMPGLPFRFRSRGRAPWFTRAAPVLGEHTTEVLTELLGFDDDDLAELERKNVIGRRPLNA